jgi:F-type H+-transporting ATPase subunit a
MTNGPINYLKHFAVMPGVPIMLAPMIFVIEIISHLSRVLSLTLRLFGNIFGEHLVVLIIASIVPFLAPLPIQFLGLIVGPLQAFIFLTLGAIYLTAATHVDDHHGHGDDLDFNEPSVHHPQPQTH